MARSSRPAASFHPPVSSHGTGPGREPVPLVDSLELLQRYLGTARPSAIAVLQDSWRQIIGSRLADRCELRSLHHGRLVIASDDPGVAEQLRWMSVDLCAAANAVIGSRDVVEVEVRVGSGGS